jgi:hypothetical protein
MANKILTRVLDTSKQRGAARCLIIVLADVADEHGIAYPGIKYLAGQINEDESYTYKLVRKLIDDGELLHKPGGGRGRKTTYAVVAGLTDTQRARTNDILQCRVYHEKPAPKAHDRAAPPPINPVPQNSVLQNSVLQNSVLQNTVIDENKPYTILDTNYPQDSASESAQPAIVENMIHGSNHDGSSSSGARAILRKCGIYNGTIRQVLALGIDEDTLIASVEALHRAGWGAGAIANELRDNPPTKGHPYEQPQSGVREPAAQAGAARPTPRSPERARRSAGSHNPTGGAELHNPGWQQKELDRIQKLYNIPDSDM